MLRFSKFPKGFSNIAFLCATEYFSYYGIRSLLILFFSEYMNFSDHAAYALYGAYTALVWVTPIAGGYIADRFLGYRFSVLLGIVMLFLGNISLTLSGKNENIIYVAMAFIICGYGFFKGNVFCLAGDLFKTNIRLRDTGFSWLYVSGNIGALFAIGACGWFVYVTGSWHAGFLLASVFLLLGLLFFALGYRHFDKAGPKQIARLGQKILGISKTCWIGFSILLGIPFFCLILFYRVDGYFLIFIAVIAVLQIVKVGVRCHKEDLKKLGLLCVITLFAGLFWVFDQQNGSSLMLFVERNIDRHIGGIEVPASTFQSINSLSVIIGGLLIGYLWNALRKRDIVWSSLAKIAIGILFLAIGFGGITFSAYNAMHADSGITHMHWLIIGMSCIGFAELFIDPVALSSITRMNPGQSSGLLVGLYFVVTGSFANYVAARVATLTDISKDAYIHRSLAEVAHSYYSVFGGITMVSILFVLCVFLAAYVFRCMRVKE